MAAGPSSTMVGGVMVPHSSSQAGRRLWAERRTGDSAQRASPRLSRREEGHKSSVESVERREAAREARARLNPQDRADVEALLFTPPTQFTFLGELKNDAQTLRKAFNRSFDKCIDVGIGFSVIRIHQVRDDEETFTVDLDVSLTWEDPSVVDVKEPDWDKAWSPMLIFKNEIDSRVISKKIFVADPSRGVVFSWMRYHLTLYENLELGAFPFDRQILHVDVSSFRPTKEIRFKQHRTNKVFATSISEWRVSTFGDDGKEIDGEDETDAKAVDAPPITVIPHTELLAASDGLHYPRARFEIRVERRPEYYLYTVVVVVWGLVCLSMAAHRIHPDDFGDRMATNLAVVLSVTAYKFSVVSSFPRKHYTTWLDRYMLLSFFVLFMQGAGLYVLTYYDAEEAQLGDVVVQVVVFLPWSLYHLFLIVGRRFMFQSWAEVQRHQRVQVLI